MNARAEYIKQFKELYRQKTGTVICDTEAVEYFEKLVALVGTIYRPIPKTDNKQLTEKYERK